MRPPYGMHRPRRVDGNRRNAKASPSVFARNCPCGFRYQILMRLRAGRAPPLWRREIIRGDRVSRRDEKPSAAARRACREPGSRPPQRGSAHSADRWSQHGASSVNNRLTPVRRLRPLIDRPAIQDCSIGAVDRSNGTALACDLHILVRPFMADVCEHTREMRRGTGPLRSDLVSMPALGRSA